MRKYPRQRGGEVQLLVRVVDVVGSVTIILKYLQAA